MYDFELLIFALSAQQPLLISHYMTDLWFFMFCGIPVPLYQIFFLLNISIIQYYQYINKSVLNNLTTLYVIYTVCTDNV